MRTVYLGTSHFAVRVLDRLAASPHRPALVVTPPDRPRGRGRKLAPPPVAEAARELGIELLLEALDRADAGELELTEQPADGITYADKVDPAERRLDPARPAVELERRVRALAPAIGAFLERDGERLGVGAARVTRDDVAA